MANESNGAGDRPVRITWDKEWRCYDLLDSRIRDMMRESPFNYASEQVYDYYEAAKSELLYNSPLGYTQALEEAVQATLSAMRDRIRMDMQPYYETLSSIPKRSRAA